MTGDVLLVEDDPLLRMLLRRSLERDGYAVREAEDGTSAMAAAREAVPDAVIQDFVLPDMDGDALARSLRALPGFERVAIIALSGYSFRLDRHARGQLYDDMMLKPAMPDDIVRRLEAARERRRRANGAREIADRHEHA